MFLKKLKAGGKEACGMGRYVSKTEEALTKNINEFKRSPNFASDKSKIYEEVQHLHLEEFGDIYQRPQLLSQFCADILHP